MQLGYHLSSEEHDANTLVRLAGRAEEVGFGFATIADHFHPWTDAQGQSPFVWGVLGGIAATTSLLRVGTAVTCPLIRTHPVIVAQAAATAAAMFGDRFFLGLGTGENLNEHVTGQRWPPVDVAREKRGGAASRASGSSRSAGQRRRQRPGGSRTPSGPSPLSPVSLGRSLRSRATSSRRPSRSGRRTWQGWWSAVRTPRPTPTPSTP